MANADLQIGQPAARAQIVGIQAHHAFVQRAGLRRPAALLLQLRLHQPLLHHIVALAKVLCAQFPVVRSHPHRLLQPLHALFGPAFGGELVGLADGRVGGTGSEQQRDAQDADEDGMTVLVHWALPKERRCSMFKGRYKRVMPAGWMSTTR